MARVNYAHGKRQREIANKAKREEKLQRKAERSSQAQNGVDPDLEGLEPVADGGPEGPSEEPEAQG